MTEPNHPTPPDPHTTGPHTTRGPDQEGARTRDLAHRIGIGLARLGPLERDIVADFADELAQEGATHELWDALAIAAHGITTLEQDRLIGAWRGDEGDPDTWEQLASARCSLIAHRLLNGPPVLARLFVMELKKSMIFGTIASLVSLEELTP